MKQMFELGNLITTFNDLDDLMKQYWEPRELESTQPPLILSLEDMEIENNRKNFVSAEIEDKEFELQIKELPSTLPPLIVDFKKHKNSSHVEVKNTSTSEELDNDTVQKMNSDLANFSQ